MAFLNDEEKKMLSDLYHDMDWYGHLNDFECVLCNGIAINHYVSECEHVFCHECRNLYSEDKPTTCPQCERYITQPNKKDFDLEVRIHQLKAFCPNRKHGCKYADKLRKIPSHLKTCMSTKEAAALQLESPATSNNKDVGNQLKHLNATIGELLEGMRELKQKVNQMDRKTDDIADKIKALTTKDKIVEERKAEMQLASANHTEDFQEMRLQFKSMNQRIQKSELLQQQMALEMEEMRTNMITMTELKRVLQNKQSEESMPIKAEIYEWTIRNVKENILNTSKNCVYISEVFTLPGYKYDIKTRIEDMDNDLVIGLQFNDGDQIKPFLDNDGFTTVTYIIRDQSDTQNKQDIFCQDYLRFGDDCGLSSWLFVNLLPVDMLSSPYVKDDRIKIDILLKPASLDRGFVSNNGILEWRVDNYRELMDDPMYSPIYSPCFYTSPRGYRVRIELVIFDSRSIGVSVYFLTGAHDDDLTMNFPRKTTVTLINQANPSKNFVKSKHFKDLELHTMELTTRKSMEESGFVKDDSLLLKVAIAPVSRQ